MPLKLCLDESLDNRIAKALRALNFDFISVSEYSKGIPDKEVLELARKLNAVLVTEDRDFGEWVFAHHERDVSIIYLRYKVSEIKEITGSLVNVLREKKQNLQSRFIVITPRKIRVREIFL